MIQIYGRKTTDFAKKNTIRVYLTKTKPTDNQTLIETVFGRRF
ncbi:hypothetical protein C723_2844 [Christiangramia flava JLT2011]|nr:hypothetical protein C723_2844 [Christiangramia flava JLT2011]